MKIVLGLLIQIVACVWATNNTSDVTFEDTAVVRNLEEIGLVTRITAHGFQYGNVFLFYLFFHSYFANSLFAA